MEFRLRTCPSCRQAVLDDTLECPFCGADMQAEPAPVQPSPQPPTAADVPESRAPTPATPSARDQAQLPTPAATAAPHVPDAAAPPPPMLTLTCPACRSPLRVRADFLGKRVRCASCSKAFVTSKEQEASAGADAEPLPMSAEPQPGRELEVVCPMCETHGYVPPETAGRPVRCSNPSCLVPVFTAPKPDRPEPEQQTETPDDTPAETPFYKSGTFIMAAAIGAVVVAGFVAIAVIGGGDSAGYSSPGTGSPATTPGTSPRPPIPPVYPAPQPAPPGGDAHDQPPAVDLAALRNEALREIVATAQVAPEAYRAACWRLATEAAAWADRVAEARQYLANVGGEHLRAPALAAMALAEHRAGSLEAALARLIEAQQAANSLSDRGGRQELEAHVAVALATVVITAAPAAHSPQTGDAPRAQQPEQPPDPPREQPAQDADQGQTPPADADHSTPAPDVALEDPEVLHFAQRDWSHLDRAGAAAQLLVLYELARDGELPAGRARLLLESRHAPRALVLLRLLDVGRDDLAQQWLELAPPGQARDECLAALLRHNLSRGPATASGDPPTPALTIDDARSAAAQLEGTWSADLWLAVARAAQPAERIADDLQHARDRLQAADPQAGQYTPLDFSNLEAVYRFSPPDRQDELLLHLDLLRRLAALYAQLGMPEQAWQTCQAALADAERLGPTHSEIRDFLHEFFTADVPLEDRLTEIDPNADRQRLTRNFIRLIELAGLRHAATRAVLLDALDAGLAGNVRRLLAASPELARSELPWTLAAHAAALGDAETAQALTDLAAEQHPVRSIAMTIWFSRPTELLRTEYNLHSARLRLGEEGGLEAARAAGNRLELPTDRPETAYAHAAAAQLLYALADADDNFADRHRAAAADHEQLALLLVSGNEDESIDRPSHLLLDRTAERRFLADLARALAESGEFDRAFAIYARIDEPDPLRATELLAVVAAACRSGRMEEALRAADRNLEDDQLRQDVFRVAALLAPNDATAHELLRAVRARTAISKCTALAALVEHLATPAPPALDAAALVSDR